MRRPNVLSSGSGRAGGATELISGLRLATAIVTAEERDDDGGLETPRAEREGDDE
jgi:hypothetical protein